MYHSTFLVGSDIFPRMSDTRRPQSCKSPRRARKSRQESRHSTQQKRSSSSSRRVERPCTRPTGELPRPKSAALSITDVPQVCDPDYHERRPSTSRSKTPLPPSRPATVRPHTVGVPTRPRSISTARTWYYGKPPPKEAHAPVIDWNKARQIKAPIMRRRARSSSMCGKENNERTEVSVLQPYPMNYNAFLVKTLKKDMGTLYSVPAHIVIRPGHETDSSDSSTDDDVSIRLCSPAPWKMT